MKKFEILMLCAALLLIGCHRTIVVNEGEVPCTVPTKTETTTEIFASETSDDILIEECGTKKSLAATSNTEPSLMNEVTEPVTTEQTKLITESTSQEERVTEASGTTTEAVPTTEKMTEPPNTTEAPKITSISYPINYNDGEVKITIDKVWYVGAWCYVAHIQMSNYARLKTGMASGGYGATEYPTSFSSRVNPLLTVNGDYSEGLGKTVLRNGKIYGDENIEVQAVYSQSSGIFKSGKGSSVKTLRDNGFTDSFDFGANDLVVNGESVYLRKDGGKSAQRTLIGTTGTPGDIYLVVTEGRYVDGESRGLQYWEAGDFLQSLGCSFGVALDGGGSSSMIWQGQVLNKNSGRALTGYIYVTY